MHSLNSKFVRIGILTFLMSLNIVFFQNCGSGLNSSISSSNLGLNLDQNNPDQDTTPQKQIPNFDISFVNRNLTSSINVQDTGLIKLNDPILLNLYGEGKLRIGLSDSLNCSLRFDLLEFKCLEEVNPLVFEFEVVNSNEYEGFSTRELVIKKPLPTDITFSINVIPVQSNPNIDSSSLIRGQENKVLLQLPAGVSISDEHIKFSSSDPSCVFNSQNKYKFICDSNISQLSIYAYIDSESSYTGNTEKSGLKVVSLVDNLDLNLLSSPYHAGDELIAVVTGYTDSNNILISLSGNNSCNLISEKQLNKILCSEKGTLNITVNLKPESLHIGSITKSFNISPPSVIVGPTDIYKIFYTKTPYLTNDTTPFCASDVNVDEACDRQGASVSLCRRSKSPLYATFPTYDYIGCYTGQKKTLDLKFSGVLNIIKGDPEGAQIYFSNEANLSLRDHFDITYKSVEDCELKFKDTGLGNTPISRVTCPESVSANSLQIDFRIKDSFQYLKGDISITYSLEDKNEPKISLKTMTLLKIPANFYLPATIVKGGEPTHFSIINDGGLNAHDFDYTLGSEHCSYHNTEADGGYGPIPVKVIAVSCSADTPGNSLDITIKVKESIETHKGTKTQAIKLTTN